MCRSTVLTVALSVAFLFTLVSSVSADPVRQPPGQQKLDPLLIQTVEFGDFATTDIRALLSDHFADNNGKHLGFIKGLVMNEGEDLEVAKNDNNGKHLGFSVAAFNGGLRFGLSKPRRPIGNNVSQNPEPTAILLLGTGMAAGAAFVRRRTRKRRQALKQ
jgi:hypothetical protein